MRRVLSLVSSSLPILILPPISLLVFSFLLLFDLQPTNITAHTMENHRQPQPQPQPHDQPPLHQPPIQIQCPRCHSTNTKFCYYNNYNLSQPRHFCKTCCRYWTKGGALRNIPLGAATPSRRKTTTKRPAAPAPSKHRTTNKTTTAHASQQISVEADDEQPLLLLDDDCGVGVGTTTTFSSLLASYPDGGLLGDTFITDSDSGGGSDHEALCIWPQTNTNTNTNSWADLSIYTPGPRFQ